VSDDPRDPSSQTRVMASADRTQPMPRMPASESEPTTQELEEVSVEESPGPPPPPKKSSPKTQSQEIPAVPPTDRASARPGSVRRARARMTLRIPDDEIARPTSTASAESSPEPITGTRIINVGEPPPPAPESSPAAEITSVEIKLDGPPSDEIPVEVAPTSGDALERARPASEPPRAAAVARGAIDVRAHARTLIDRMEIEPEGEDVSFEEEPSRPSTPGEAAEISADDVVSVESLPGKKVKSPSSPPPPMRAKAPSVPPPAGPAPTPAAPAPASAPVVAPSAAQAQPAPAPAPAPGPAPAPAAAAAAPAPAPAASAPAPVPAVASAPAPAPAPAVSAPAATSAPAPAPPAKPPLVIVPPHVSSPLAPPPMTDAAAQRKRARPWWEELFNDDFIRTMAKITDAQIAGECDFVEDSLGLAKGAMILDLGCGTGRHAIELTRRGYHVVGFDLSLAMLARAADEAQERGQKLNFVQGDMREMTFEETFDGIFCWNTSFGFFEEEKNAQVVARVHKALKKGGLFLLDVANRDYISRQAPSLAWFEGEGCICMDEMNIDYITSRMRVKRTMMMDDGRTREIEYSIRLYTLHELGTVLHDHGFRVAEVSGRTATPGVYFGAESPRTLILAEKR
jgi:SAM-dependent methyltransferase